MEITEPGALADMAYGTPSVVITRYADAELARNVLDYLATNMLGSDKKPYERGDYVHTYANAVYQSKSEYKFGDVGKNSDVYDLHYVLRVEMVVPEYMLDEDGKGLINRLAASEVLTKQERVERLRAENLEKAASLRAEAERLEARAKELEQR